MVLIMCFSCRRSNKLDVKRLLLGTHFLRFHFKILRERVKKTQTVVFDPVSNSEKTGYYDEILKNEIVLF